MSINNECLSKEGFLSQFNKLSKVQKCLFLEKVKCLQKITSMQIGVDQNCLSVFNDLFEAYQAFSNKVRQERNKLMQSNIDICIA